ncbi:hypothetical protein D3C77_509820 [compost metagenome]
MRNLKRLLLMLFLLVLVAVVLLFTLENQQVVNLVLLGWSMPAIPVALVVVIALLVGLVLGPLIGVFIARRTIARSRKSI